MRFLRKGSTCNVLVGPVIKSTDGYSPLTGMTSDLVGIDFYLHTTDGALTTYDYEAGNSFATFGNGYINLGLRSSNVNYIGSIRIVVDASDSGIPTFDDFHVLNTHVYDALFCASGTERLQTDVHEITSTAISTASAQLGVNVIQISSVAVSTASAQMGVNVIQWASADVTNAPLTTGTVYDTMDHGTLMSYLQAYAIGDFGATGPSTNVLAYKNYSGTTVMSHTFTTKTREWSSA